MPGASSVKMHNPSSGPSGRGQFGNRVSEAASSDPLIGRKVRTRWPDNNNYYEAVITDYNAAEVHMILWLMFIYLFIYVFMYLFLVVSC